MKYTTIVLPFYKLFSAEITLFPLLSYLDPVVFVFSVAVIDGALEEKATLPQWLREQR